MIPLNYKNFWVPAPSHRDFTGYSRPSFYLVASAFSERGMAGLLDERPGRRGPVKLTAEIVDYLLGAPGELSGAELAAEVERRFGVGLHRRTVERARRR